MAKPKILLVDADEKSLSMMTISLKKAGYNVTSARNGEEAWELVRTSQPDLIISDTKMPRMDGFTFCRKVKDEPATRSLPFIFLTREKSVDEKIRGLELGVDDYLTKPIYLKEVLARVKLLIEKREKVKGDYVSPDSQFSGSLTDMGVVDLIQTMEMGQKTGVVYMSRAGFQAQLAFEKGRLIDAILGNVRGEAAVYKLLIWSDGTFRIDFRDIKDFERSVNISTQGLIMEGMRRIDELVRIREQLPSLESCLAIDSQMILEEHPDQFPEKIENILAEFTGRQNIQQVVDKLPYDDLEVMEIVAKLYFQGFLMPVREGEVNLPVEAKDAPRESEPLFDLAPPVEDDTAEGDAAPKAAAREPAPPPAPPPVQDVSAQEPAAEVDVEEEIPVEFEEDPAADSEADVPGPAAAAPDAPAEKPQPAQRQKARPKQGKVIYLKGPGNAAAAAVESEPEPAPADPVPPPKPPAREISIQPKAPPAPAAPPAPQPRPAAKPASRPVAPPVIDPADLVPAAAASAAPAAPPARSKTPILAAAAALVLALGSAGAWFVLQDSTSGTSGTVNVAEFRDAALKLTGEDLEYYKGASLAMNLDTPTGYRSAIAGFETIVGRMQGWVDGTDQEIVLSKLILSYARLGASEDDEAPLRKAAELAAGYLSERPASLYLLLADAETRVRLRDFEGARAATGRIGNSAEAFYLYNFVVGLMRLQEGTVPDLALVALRKAVEQNPDFTLGHFELARAYDASKRPADAANHYKSVINHSPNHAEAHFQLSRMALDAGDSETGLKHVRTAVAVNGEYLPGRLLLSRLLVESGDYEGARPHLQTVIELARTGTNDDLLASARKLSGQVAEATGDLQRARREYELALQIAAGDPEATEALTRLQSGTATVAAAPAPARPAVREAPKPVIAARAEPQKPTPPPAPARTAAKAPAAGGEAAARAFAEAQNYYRRGYLKNAVAKLSESLKLNGNDDKAWALLGQIYIELEQNDNALKALQRAIALNARNADAHVNLGGLYDVMGDAKRADAAYRRYLQLEPNGRFANDVRKLLSSR